MRKYILTCLSGLFCLLLLACGDRDSFKVEGTFARTDPTPVKLYLLKDSGTELVDSVMTDDNTFVLSGSIATTNIFMVEFFNKQQIYLVIRPRDDIGLDIDNSMEEISYYVANSPDSRHIKELFDEQEKVLKKIDLLSRDYEQHLGDPLARKRIDSAYFAIMEEHQVFTRNFIASHPKSLANIMALYQNFGRKSRPLFDRYDDFDIFNYVDSSLTAVYPESYPVIALNRDLMEIREQLASRTYIQKKVEVGYPLPEASLSTLDGDTFQVGDPENYTLLIFWASWNPYSVSEVLQLQDLLEEDSGLKRNLTCITLSIDTSPEKLQSFISRNEISLPVVCDYQYWDSELVSKYAVKQIPSVIIADRSGKVVSRDIFSSELHNYLKETLP